MTYKTYSDDTPGWMRVHIADARGLRACAKYTRDALRAHAKAHGVRAGWAVKRDLAWYMAQHGLIDADGNLRDGFPAEWAALPNEESR